MSWTLLDEDKDLIIATESMVILAMKLDFHYTRLFDVIFLHNLIIGYGHYDPIYHLRRVYHATERKLFQFEEKWTRNDFVKGWQSKSC